MDVPKPDGGIISSTGKRAAIGSKGESKDAAGMLTHPVQGTVSQAPQLDSSIPTPGSQRAPIRAEGESRHRAAMRLPGQVQNLPSLAPYACFPQSAARSSVVPIRTGVHRPGGVKGLAKDSVAQRGPGMGSSMQFAALQGRPSKDKLRQIQAGQVPALLVEQCQHVRWSVSLGVLSPLPQASQQDEQALLHFIAPTVHTAQVRE